MGLAKDQIVLFHHLKHQTVGPKGEACFRAKKEARAQVIERKHQQMSEWNEEELRMLDKSLKKFPQVLQSSPRWMFDALGL